MCVRIRHRCHRGERRLVSARAPRRRRRRCSSDLRAARTPNRQLRNENAQAEVAREKAIVDASERTRSSHISFLLS